MDFDYNKLKIFLTVVSHGSVTKAAKALYRTQSAVSQSLHALESQLGLKLIEWEGKRLKLTRQGQLVFQAASERMSVIDEQLSVIAESGDEVGGRIEIGLLHDNSTSLNQWVYDQIAQFRKRYPKVQFSIHFGSSQEIEAALIDRTIDVGFLINFSEQHRFERVEVAVEEHSVVATPRYLEGIGGIDSIKDVIAANLIDIDSHYTCFIPWVQKHDRELVETLNCKEPEVSVADFEAIRALVCADQGIGVVPKYLIQEDLERGSLVLILPDLESLTVRVDCARVRNRQPRQCEQLFLDTIDTHRDV